MSERVEPAALHEAQTEPDAPVVLDVRSPTEYAAGHVPGAINIPIDRLEQRQRELPKDRLIVPYCNMQHPGSSRGERARDQLVAAGFTALTLAGGFPAWRAAGLEVEHD